MCAGLCYGSAPEVPHEVTTAAIVLRSVDYGEADRIVTLLTESRGCVAAIARGARRSRRRFGGALEPFAVLEVDLALQRGELQRLGAARVVRSCLGILGDLAKLEAAGQALTFVRGVLTEAGGEPELYHEAVALLLALDLSPSDQAERLRQAFATRVLALSGWEPDLQRCGFCERVPRPTQPVEFDPQRGHLVCRSCGGGPVGLAAQARAFLVAMAASGVAGAADWDLPVPVAGQVERALQELLRCHVPKFASRG